MRGYIRQAHAAVDGALQQITRVRLDRFSELREAITSHLDDIFSMPDMQQQVLAEIEPQLSLLSAGYHSLGASI